MFFFDLAEPRRQDLTRRLQQRRDRGKGRVLIDAAGQPRHADDAGAVRETRDARTTSAMSVSFGFGGSCASLMFRAWHG